MSYNLAIDTEERPGDKVFEKDGVKVFESHVGGEEDLKALAKAVIEAWEAIPQEQIDDLIKSMPRRCVAVVKAKGWHTKY